MTAAPAGGGGAGKTAADSRTSAPSASAVLARVEKQLRDLWSAPEKSGETPKSRACTMNLVVIAPSREIADRYTSIVDDVTQSIPARAIVVALDPAAPGGALEAEVSAVCAPGEGGTTICSERVSLVAKGNVCARVGSAVEALCVPEIPTSLVWLGRVHTDDPVFVTLAREAQRIILDTDYTSLTSLVQLARWAREMHGAPHVADMAWTRIAPWQEMCARFFDEPRLRPLAFKVTRVALAQACETKARLGPEGALLLGWLATRLGWTPMHVGGLLRFKRADGETVEIALDAVPRPTGVSPAAIASISIAASDGAAHVKGTIERDLGSSIDPNALDADVLVWRLDAGEGATFEHRVRLRANKGAKVLERTLHRPPEDPTLALAVAFAEQVFEDGVVCG